MKLSEKTGMILAGTAAGAVGGLFGAGGGMVLVPLLDHMTNLKNQVFAASVSIILPICLVSLATTTWATPLPIQQAWPYLIGSSIGGFAAGLIGKRIPTTWLHRLFGILIIWGGIRNLC